MSVFVNENESRARLNYCDICWGFRRTTGWPCSV